MHSNKARKQHLFFLSDSCNSSDIAAGKIYDKTQEGVTLLINSRKRAIWNCWHEVENFVKGGGQKKEQEKYVELQRRWVRQTDGNRSTWGGGEGEVRGGNQWNRSTLSSRYFLQRGARELNQGWIRPGGGREREGKGAKIEWQSEEEWLSRSSGRPCEADQNCCSPGWGSQSRLIKPTYAAVAQR